MENRKDVVKVRCKLCGMQLVHGGGTTTLASHLLAKHTEEYTCSFGSPASSKNQTTLPTNVRKCSAEHAATITRLNAEFVARDLRPLSIVCGDGFQQLLNNIEPGYQVPSHTHITTVCWQIFHTKKEELHETLKGQTCCADNEYLDQPCYTGVPNRHSTLHNSRVKDGKCSAAN